MSAATDNAYASSATADAASAVANSAMTSQAHFAASSAHSFAASAWLAINTTAAKVTYHTTTAQTHTNSAIQLKTAGK